jgi:hypothetical protein
MTRIVVAIDLAVTSGEEADETGIVVAGKDKNGHGYVLADISGRYLPIEWARWRSPPTQLRLKGVRRDKAALSSGCKPHPAIRSSRKQSEQSWR